MTPQDLQQQLEHLTTMKTGELIDRYMDVFGQPTLSRHRAYLVRKIAWRIQANAQGGLSQRALDRAAGLANDADVRLMPPKHMLAPVAQTLVAPLASARDPRLPARGTAITRKYKGEMLRVLILEDGFEFDGNRFKTLTAVAQAITGSHINGFRFFNLKGQTT
jgi:hypothetical protein